MTIPRHADTQRVFEVIARARRDGRPIVPLLGGGVSTECGLPTTAGLVDYLAALHLYVRKRAFVPDNLFDRLPALAEPFRAGVPGYVDSLNWPDPHQVVEGIWRWGRGRTPDEMDELLYRELDQLAGECGPHRAGGLREVVAGVLSAGADPLPPGAVWRAVGDWKDLLRWLAGYDAEALGQLFTRLNRLPRPGLSHRFLAALVRVLGVRRFLTVTMDSLLEQALAAEDIEHRVSPLGEGLVYPSSRHLREAVAVIKLHGAADRAVVDERLDHPVDADLMARFRTSFPGTGLLLVIGCGGRDRRVLDLVERGVLPVDRASSPVAPRVVWLHHEDQPPDVVLRWRRDWPSAVYTAGLQSPGHFLRHLYWMLTTRNPAGGAAYRAHSEGPVFIDAGRDDPIVWQESPGTGSAVDGVRVARRADGRFTLFDSRHHGSSAVGKTATERLAEWVSDQPQGVIPIWVDLEGQYTIPGVVGAIVDHCRRYDPDLAPVVLPLGEPTGEMAVEDLGRAADRIAEALRRGRYVLALDGFETFPWPQTHHHGTSEVGDKPQHAILRVKALARLVTLVINHRTGLGWSRVGLSVNTPRGRHEHGPEGMVAEALFAATDDLRTAVGATEQRVIPHLGRGQSINNPADSDPQLRGVLYPAPAWNGASPLAEDDADLVGRLVLFGVTCFRRTRTLVGLREVVGKFCPGSVSDPHRALGPGAEFDTVIDALCDLGYLSRVEGGMFWMRRDLRDRIYSFNSHFTKREHIRRVMEGGGSPTAAELAQLLLLALFHDLIARYYYFDTFIPSRDPQAFFEYVYHRVSSIRYLTRLIVVREYGLRGGSPAGWDELFDRLGRVCREPFASATEDVFDDRENLVQVLNRRRLREVASLRLAWSLAHRELLARVPAEQLVSWFRWLIDDDLNRFRTEYYAELLPDPAPHRRRCQELDTRVATEVGRLRQDLYTLWAQCSRERTNLAGCVWVSFRHIQSYLPTGTGSGRLAAMVSAILERPVPEGRRLGPPDWPTLRAVIDEVGKSLCPPTAGTPDPARESIAAVASVVRERFADLGPDRLKGLEETVAREIRADLGPASNRRESLAILSALIDVAECYAAGARVAEVDEEGVWEALRKITHDVDRAMYLRVLLFSAEAKLRARADGASKVEQVIDLTDLGLIAARWHDLPDRALGARAPYFYHRTRLLTVRGAAHGVSRTEEGFQRAYQDFERARGTIEPPDWTLAAQIDLRAAECALEHGDWHLRPGADGHDLVILDRADAKYVIAEGYLRRAFHQLLHARRNVLWWSEYFRLHAAYKARRNLWRATFLATLRRADRGSAVEEAFRSRIATPPPPAHGDAVGSGLATHWLRERRVLSRFNTTLRHGLVSVRHGRDLELCHDGSTWHPRMLDLLHVGYAWFARSCLALPWVGESVGPPAGLVSDYWHWLLGSVGIDEKDHGVGALFDDVEPRVLHDRLLLLGPQMLGRPLDSGTTLLAEPGA